MQSTHSERLKNVPIKELEQHVPGDPELPVEAQSHQPLIVNQWQFPHILEDAPALGATNLHNFGIVSSGAIQGHHQHNGGAWKKARLGHKEWIMGSAGQNGIAWRWKADCPESVPLSVLDIYLSPKVLADVATEVLGVDGSRVVEIRHQLNAKDAFMEQLTLSVLQEVKSGCPFGKMFMDTAAQMLSLHVLRHHCTHKHRVIEYRKGGLSPTIHRRVVDYIHENVSADISLAVLAGIANMSVHHFARMFKQSFDETPHRYIMRHRMEQAKLLLVETTDSVSEVAYKVGCRSVSHFSQLFKTHAGVTPKKYRLML